MTTKESWTFELRDAGERGYEYVVHLTARSREWHSWGWGDIDRIIIYGSGLGQNSIGSDPDTRATAEANARLIAAAPDLLQCLKYALAHIDGGDVGGSGEVLKNGYASIAKAEGREPNP